MFLVVTYDIVDDQRRERVASELANFGERVQYSVFECHLTPAQVQDLQQRLDRLIAQERIGCDTIPCAKRIENVFSLMGMER